MKTFSIFLSIFITALLLILFCSVPTDPVNNPQNVSVRLFFENDSGSQPIPFGATRKLAVSLYLPKFIKALHIWSGTGDLDSCFDYTETVLNDTIVFTYQFLNSGEGTMFVAATLTDTSFNQPVDSLTYFVSDAPVSLEFDSIPQSASAIAGNTDTLLFITSKNRNSPIDFSVKSTPTLDSSHLRLIKSNDSARILFSPDKPGIYSVHLTAICDTVVQSASVDIEVYNKLALKNVMIPDTAHLENTDTLYFLLPSDRNDTISCTIVNNDSFLPEEIRVIRQSSDSLVVTFTPDSTGLRQFAILLTNGHISDTVYYTILVCGKLSFWNYAIKNIETIEGQKTNLQLKPLLHVSAPEKVQLQSDLGTVADGVWNWIAPWGADTFETGILTALFGSDTSRMKLDIIIKPGDTIGPSIKLLNSGMIDTIIGSSQLIVQAIIRDSLSGTDSVIFAFDSASTIGIKKNDSTFLGAIMGLQPGKKTEIQILATDRSMKHNPSTLSFFLTFDSTLNDAVPPVIIQKKGPANLTRAVTNKDTCIFTITDDSGVDSVFWKLNDSTSVPLSPNQKLEYIVPFTLNRYGDNRIVIYAVDNSINKNTDSLVLRLHYNTEPVLNLSKDTEVSFGETVTLSATVSGEDTTVPASYTWRQIDGDTTVSIINASSVSFTAPPKVTTISFTVTALRDSLTSKPETVSVRIWEDFNKRIFIAPWGNDINSGTQLRPFLTFQAAIDAAGKSGADVYVGCGTYTCTKTINILSKTSIYGGFDSTFSSRKPEMFIASVHGAATAMRCFNADSIRIDGISINADNAHQGGGESSTGLIVDGCKNIYLLNIKLISGTGGSGANGATGVDGVNGNNGGAGGCAGRYGTSGSAGTGGDGAGSGGKGGNGSCSGVGQDGTNGLNATEAADGVPSSRLGTLDTSGYIPPVGFQGTSGKDGKGGKGGNSTSVTDGSLCGGGGGEGGGGGKGGKGGQGGGGSFGIIVMRNSQVVIENSVIKSGSGGDGGIGGAGGGGGSGGSGGKGGSGCSLSGTGAAGTAGESGQNGGYGGGGVGGPSICILEDSTSTVYLSGNTYDVGEPGLYTFFKGNNAEDGIAAAVKQLGKE